MARLQFIIAKTSFEFVFFYTTSDQTDISYLIRIYTSMIYYWHEALIYMIWSITLGFQ